jgi:acyl carrier protein phosphodiesterase
MPSVNTEKPVREPGDTLSSMNYLMHLYLSGDNPETLVGNMMGDFVKGRLDERYPPGIRRGIELHRRIDSFAAGNPFFIRSKRRIDPSFRHYRGVLVDVFYDHFLARHWDEYRIKPYRDYISESFALLVAYEKVLPARLCSLLPRIFSADWLLSYPHTEGVASVLERMSKRVNRPNPLAEGIGELSLRYGQLLGDFRQFLPGISEYVREWSGLETFRNE